MTDQTKPPTLRVVRTLDEAIDGWEDGSFTAFGPEHAHALITAARSWRSLLNGEAAAVGGEVVEVTSQPLDLKPGRYLIIPVEVA